MSGASLVQESRARLPARTVEDLVGAVERHREQRFRLPLERALLAARQRHDGRAVAVEHVEERLVEMLDRRGLPARLDLDHVVGHEVAAAVRVAEAPARVVARPRAGLDREQVVAEVEMDRHALAVGPIHVGIEQVAVGEPDAGSGLVVVRHVCSIAMGAGPHSTAPAANPRRPSARATRGRSGP